MIKLAILENEIYETILYIEDKNERLVRTIEISDNQVDEFLKLHEKGRLNVTRLQEK